MSTESNTDKHYETLKVQNKNTRCQCYVHRYKDNYVIKWIDLFQHPLAMIQWHCQMTMLYWENGAASVTIRWAEHYFTLLHFVSVKLVLRELCSNVKAYWKGQMNKLYGSTVQPLALCKSAPMKIMVTNLRSSTPSFFTRHISQLRHNTCANDFQCNTSIWLQELRHFWREYRELALLPSFSRHHNTSRTSIRGTMKAGTGCFT